MKMPPNAPIQTHTHISIHTEIEEGRREAHSDLRDFITVTFLTEVALG